MTTTIRPEIVARIRLATRLLAFGDPRASSTLPPFARARRFLEHLCTLDAGSWQRVSLGADDDAEARDGAEQLLRDVSDAPATRVARDAIAAEARRVVRHASELRLLAADETPRAARLVASATLALVFRDQMPDGAFRTLYAPFRNIAPPPYESQSGT